MNNEKRHYKIHLSMHEEYEHNTELNLEQLRVDFEDIFLTALIHSSQF